MSLAIRLKTSRKKLGLSQVELAKQVSVSQPTIANWERGGHIPRPDALARIANVLGTDSAWLLSGEHPASSNPAHHHLAKPIHHIPVYEWPTHESGPTDTQPNHYMAIAADITGMFGLYAAPSTGFPEGTILIFSKSDQSLPGRFLVKEVNQFSILERKSVVENVFGRLIYSIVPH